MKVGYVGNFRVPWSTETHVAAAFAELGHAVIQIEGHKLTDRELRARALGCDMVVYAPGRNHVTRDGIRALDAEGIMTVGYHLDLFFGLGREEQIATDPLFACTVVCTPDGGHDLDWIERGVYHVNVRAGVHGPEAIDVEPDPRWWRYDVAFVGSTDSYHAEWPHRRVLVGFLRDLYGDRFVEMPAANGGQRLHGLALNSFYASVPVIVGDSCFAHIDARYWSDRPYEVWGRGGYLVMPFIGELGEEIGYYPGWTPEAWGGLRDAIEDALANEEKRAACRQQFGAQVRKVATYKNRAAELVAASGMIHR